MMEAGARIAIFNQAYGPLLRDFVDALAETGAECTLFTGRGWEKKGSFRAGVIIRSGPPLNRKSMLTRGLSWFAYTCTAALALLRFDAKERVVLFSIPPVLPLFGWLGSKVRGYQYSVIVYDIYPDVLIGMGLVDEPNIAVRGWRALNRRAYESAFAVITLGNVMAVNVARQFNPALTKAGRVIIARPWVDTTLIRPIPKHENRFAVEKGLVGRLTVLYSGNMGLTHDMEAILGAARLLESKSELTFLLIGAGAGFEAVESAARGLGNVKVFPWQPEELVPYIWASAEIAIVTLRSGIEQCSFPSKTPFALSAGCAIIGITQTPSDLAELIGSRGCGMVVSPGDSHELARCLTAMVNDRAALEGYRAHARAAAEELFAPAENIAAMVGGVPGNESDSRLPGGAGLPGSI